MIPDFILEGDSVDIDPEVEKFGQLVLEYRENIGDDIVVKVLHSRFTVQDRNLKEEEILNDGATACKKKVIWVATQVVEASLDIDFDVNEYDIAMDHIFIAKY